ncbi:MAG: hypothetical protein ACRC9L_08125 [Brevinema sp.]
MLKRWILLGVFLTSSTILFADPRIAPYIVDGDLVLYAPSLSEVSRISDMLLQKYQGAEGKKTLAYWQDAMHRRMGVNPFQPQEAESIGLDPTGAVAYVHVKDNHGYMIFTLKNKVLFTYAMDNLSQPVPYRILDNFAILTASEEILDYTNFGGIEMLSEFKTIAKALDFRWTRPFLWMKGSYLRSKLQVGSNRYVFPDGDRIGMVCTFTDRQISVDAFTVYKDKDVQDMLKSSMKQLLEQKLSLLDFESGTPAIVGQAYLSIPSYVESLVNIDKSDTIELRRFFSLLEGAGINIKDRLFPYLRGRISYVVRAYSPLTKVLDLTVTMGINNDTRVRDFLVETQSIAQRKGLKIQSKTLFTREFTGFVFPQYGFTLWMGIVEGHLVLSTSETELNNLVKNIYEKNGGFLQTLPSAFVRAIQGRVYGGQTLLRTNPLLQKVQPAIFPRFSSYLLPFETIEWYYYVQDIDGTIGRRDTMTGYFFSGRPK